MYRFLALRFRRFFSELWWYWIPGIFMLILISVFYDQFYNVLNPDLVAYFSVARHYQNLDFKEAFNSYWSPLVSWVMSLTPSLKTNPMSVFRWVNIVAALLIYHQLFFWIRLAIRKKYTRFLAGMLAAFFLAGHVLRIGSPDFISLLSFLLFLRVLFKKDSSFEKSVLLALTVLLCFFTKTFLLPLCIASLLLYWGGIYFQTKKLPGATFLIRLVSVIGLGLLVWSICLKIHYGEFMLSSVVKYNSSEPLREAVHLLPPVSEKAVFIWEDPYYIKVTPEYSGDFKKRISKLFDRWRYSWHLSIYYFKYISWLWFGILLVPITGFLLKKNTRNKTVLFFFGIFLLNWLGYFSIIMQERYLLIGQFLLYLSVLGFSEQLIEIGLKRISFSGNRIIQSLLMVLIFVSMAKNPIQESYHEWKNFPLVKREVELAYKLSDSGILNGKHIASYQDSELLVYNSIGLACFLGGGQYYGEMDAMNNDELQQQEIHRSGLDILISVDCNNEVFCKNKEWLRTKKLLLEVDGLKFYGVK